MSEYEIEMALAEMLSEEEREQDFINWCELMEREYSDVDNDLSF